MDGSALAQQEFLEAEFELAVGLISNSVTYLNCEQKLEQMLKMLHQRSAAIPHFMKH